MIEKEVEFVLGEPAEVLVDLARRGEIDPWDIDIALATEKFLQYIDSGEEGSENSCPDSALCQHSLAAQVRSDGRAGGRRGGG